PFIQMAAGGPSQIKPKGNGMTFDIVVGLINRLLEAVKPGTTLPESVDESTFDDIVPTIIDAILGGEATEETTESGEIDSEAVIDEALPEEESLEMAAAFKGLKQDIIAAIK